MNDINDKLSIVLLSYNSANRISATTEKVISAMNVEKIPFELIIIDDGSGDDSFAIAQLLEQRYTFVKSYQMAKNYGATNAQFAGLHVCTGDSVVFIPDDLQRPLSVVIDMYREWQKGHKLIIAHRSDRNDGLVSDFLSRTFYFLMNKFSHVQFPPGGADGFLADREIIDILRNRISTINTTPIVEVLKLGFEPKLIPFARPGSISKSRWTMRKKWKLAVNSFFAASTFPLKFISWLGFVVFSMSIVLIIVFVLSKLFFDSTVLGFPIPGWTSLVLLMLAFNGLILLCLGILAEYIWRIFDEVKKTPNFIIKKQSKQNKL